MPRDAKGNPFGIDTVVETPNGKMKVDGFVVVNSPLSREEIAQMAQLGKGQAAYFWHEVEVADPSQNPWQKHDEHTDTCWADVAQRDGLQLPSGDQAVRDFLKEYDPLKTGLACKVVWGGVLE